MRLFLFLKYDDLCYVTIKKNIDNEGLFLKVIIIHKKNKRLLLARDGVKWNR